MVAQESFCFGANGGGGVCLQQTEDALCHHKTNKQTNKQILTVEQVLEFEVERSPFDIILAEVIFLRFLKKFISKPMQVDMMVYFE